MLLQIENLSKLFGEKEVLNIPQLSIGTKELVGILGNNGAGKTTLFRLCLDLLKADSGFIAIEDKKVNESNEWKKGTSAFVDERFLIDFLTPEEYFYYVGELYGVDKSQIDLVLNDFIPFMDDEILNKNKRIEQFSKGNKQKIGIIGAMLLRPKLLILDEPFNFLDPSSQIRIKRLLQEYNEKYNMTILLSSHNIQHITDICNRIILLELGHVIKDEVDLDNDQKLNLKSYFGNRK